MIIGFDGSRAFNNNKTGTENYSYQLLTHLAKIDQINQYYVYLRGGNERGAPLTARSAVATSEDVEWGCELTGPLKHWPSNFRFITLLYPRLWTQIGLAKQTFRNKLDILFIPSHTLPLIRKPGLKTIITVHDLGVEYLPQTHQLKQRAYLKLITDFQLKSASHLIAVSKATKNDLVKKADINPQKITVIYEGYDKTTFKPLKTDELKDILKYYELERYNYFLFVGTIQPRKNLERLIKAYAKVIKKLDVRNWKIDEEVGNLKLEEKNLASKFQPQDPASNLHHLTSIPKLVLAGSKGWLSDEIYKLPQKLGIEHQVKFLGYVPDKDLPILYNGAIALLFPSLFEGFGLPILEAMACGTPVLTSNTSSMPEITGKAAMLVNPYSEEQIAQGISRLFSDQILKNKLKRVGIAQAQKFSWEKCARETLKVLEITSN